MPSTQAHEIAGTRLSVNGKTLHDLPKTMGWEDVKKLSLASEPLKEISRLSGFTAKGIAGHAKSANWPAQQAMFSATMYRQMVDQWGKTAEHQTEHLKDLHQRMGDLFAAEVTAWEQHPPKTRAELNLRRQRSAIMGSLGNTLTQVTQGLRLLIGQSTQRTENYSLSQLVVELRANGYGESPRAKAIREGHAERIETPETSAIGDTHP